MAEEVKIKIGSATVLKISESQKMEVRGRDAFTGLPRTIEITSDEVTEAISEIVKKIITAAKGVLEQIPPELASDIIDKGIVMSGGTSLLRNLDKSLTDSLRPGFNPIWIRSLPINKSAGLLSSTFKSRAFFSSQRPAG